MKGIFKSVVIGCFLVFATFAASSIYAAEELDILTGDEWIKLTPEHKVMFISGIGHVVEFERQLMGKEPSLESKSFIPHLVQGLRGKPIKEVVKEIDIYYDANPKELSLPVYHILVVKVAVPK
ncbi:MAG: hypothetical protein V1689_02010 [Pseudomonadota bacterium]